jgi:hypothetical protein
MLFNSTYKSFIYGCSSAAYRTDRESAPTAALDAASRQYRWRSRPRW